MTREFRPDIEGLRGLAVLAVVLFHAFPRLLPGGFAGVDVFFVISGFLITSLLRDEAASGVHIDFLAFWGRRIRRILPAACLVLIAIALAALFLPGRDTRELGRQIIAASLFYFNWRQIRTNADYLADDQRENPVLHFWSLAVEEQFYIVWPLLLGAFLWLSARRHAARSRDAIVPIWPVVMLWTASFGYGAYLSYASPAAAFFDTGARAWQLLTGAIVALFAAPRPSSPAAVRQSASIAAALVLLGSFVVLSASVAYPGIAALLPVCAAAYIIWAGADPRGFVSQALANPLLRALGRISYSWYLWHWPFLVIGRELFPHTSLAPFYALLLSLAAAVLTTRFIEDPIRHGAWLARNAWATFALGAALVSTAFAAGLALKSFGPDEVAIAPGVTASAEAIARDRPRIYADDCMLGFDEIEQPPCSYGQKDAARTIVLFGDSHAGNWFVPLDAAATAAGMRLLVRIKASCRPVEGIIMVKDDGFRPYRECTDWRENVLKEIEELKPALIVISGARHNLAPAGERRILERLANIAPTLAMRDTPWLPQKTTTCLKQAKSPELCRWPLAKLMDPSAYPRTPAAMLPAGVRLVDLNTRICPRSVCNAVVGPNVIMFDNNHLTASFSRTLARDFTSLIERHAKPAP